MIDKNVLDCVYRFLQDLHGNNKPFGGKIILLGGDFRQILPVIPKGSKGQILNASIKYSPLWSRFITLRLTRNMRVRPEEIQYCQWLIQLGNGTLSPLLNDTQYVRIPEQCLAKHEDDVIQFIFGNKFQSGDLNIINDAIKSSIILAITNEDVLRINEKVLQQFPGDMLTSYSADTLFDDDQQTTLQCPIEYLHSQTPNGLPYHILNLKKGCTVMLLRNMDIQRKLVNGTRLIVKNLHRHLLEVALTDDASNTSLFLPRIVLTTNGSDTAIPMSRRQFPVRLSFAVTINKSQGQTFESVGLILTRNVFTHGQGYVAMSRCKSVENLKVKLDNEDNLMVNVVYSEIL